MLFDLNDFDETAFGPWEWDVKRLVVSAVIGGRDRGFDTDQCTQAALSVALGYRRALRDLFEVSARSLLLPRATPSGSKPKSTRRHDGCCNRRSRRRKRTSDHVLGKITEVDDHGTHRIVDQFPVIRHDEIISQEQLSKLYDAYRATMRTDVAYLLHQFPDR